MLNCCSMWISRKLLALLVLLNLIYRIQSNPLLTEITSDEVYNDLRAIGGSCAIMERCKENRTADFLRFLNCHCDSSCVDLDTCCIDSQFRPLRPQPSRPDLGCSDGYYGAFDVFMVVNCRRDWIDDGFTASLCLTNGKDIDDPFLDMPVTNLRTGISYKNYFCSVCNEDLVDEDQMAVWDILIKGKENLVTSSTVEHTSNTDKSVTERSTPKVMASPTWIETVNPMNSRAVIDTSDLKTSPTIEDADEMVTNAIGRDPIDQLTSSTEIDITDLVIEPNTRETIDLVTSPTIRDINGGTSPTVKSFASLTNNPFGQDRRFLDTITFGKNATDKWTNATMMETRIRLIRAVTDETDTVTLKEIPKLKYNASLQTWMVQLQNSSTIPVTVRVTLPDKAWKFVKTCHPGLISECSINWTDASVAQKCSSYMFLTRTKRNGTTFRYKNPHCAICNHESLDDLVCVEETRSFGMGGSTDLYEAFFVGLFVLEDRKKKCRQDMVYDSLFKKCRVVKCPQKHTFKDKKCVKEES